MELRVLNYFVTIVQEGNISKAANVLHISQSTLSRQIHELEMDLGTTLFQRGKRTIKLTDDGKFLYSRAQEILQIAQSTSKVIRSGELVTGDLVIGIGENYMVNIVSSVFHQLLEQYPDIKIHLHNIPGNLIPDEIDRGVLDFGFVTTQRNLDNYPQLSFNHQDSWGLLMPKQHHLANLNQITPNDLSCERLIVGRQQGLIRRLQNWWQDNAKNIKTVGTYDMTESMNIMVASEIGLAVTFDKPEYHHSDNDLVFKKFADFPVSTSRMIWKNDRQQSKLEKAFLNLIKNKTNM